MTSAKIQHYVPQFLLRNFGNGKKDQLWVFDKRTGRVFKSNTKNVASESHFYNFQHQGQTVSLEPWLGKIERGAKAVIRSILASDSLRTITEEQKQDLATFLAVQLTRTKTFREQWDAFPRLLRERLQRENNRVALGSQAERLIEDIPANELKEQTARITYSAPGDYAPSFLNKCWVLAATTRKAPFFVSDNPLARQNMVDRPNRGNLGLNVLGIEIYLPLSPTRALAMWCPSLVEAVHREAASARVRRGPSGHIVNPQGAVEMSDALLNGGPVHYSAANVENFNSLQVAWSERYIFSTIDDFSLAQTMLAAQPSFVQGPRMVFS